MSEPYPLPEISVDVYSARVLGCLLAMEQGFVLTKMAHMADLAGRQCKEGEADREAQDPNLLKSRLGTPQIVEDRDRVVYSSH